MTGRRTANNTSFRIFYQTTKTTMEMVIEHSISFKIERMKIERGEQIHCCSPLQLYILPLSVLLHILIYLKYILRIYHSVAVHVLRHLRDWFRTICYDVLKLLPSFCHAICILRTFGYIQRAIVVNAISNIIFCCSRSFTLDLYSCQSRAARVFATCCFPICYDLNDRKVLTQILSWAKKIKI